MDTAFLTIKWGVEFHPDDINTLKRAALANTSSKIRFICLTDNSTGLDTDIEVYPIPDFDLYDDTPKIGIWPKISLFHPDVADYADCFVFLDIDTIVTSSLDDLCKDPDDTLMMLAAGQRWRQMDASLSPSPATAFMTYRPLHHTHIFETFKANKAKMTDKFLLEQQFVGDTAHKIDYFPLLWVQSFKYHLRRLHLVDILRPPSPPAHTTKLVAFHGFPRPFSVADRGATWARPPRCGWHRPSWVIDYYSKFSDRTV
jgi:hypothetical protein